MVHIIGIDLSGPSNNDDTSVTVFTIDSAEVRFVDRRSGATDYDIVDMLSRLPSNAPIVAALDAPLSYEPGGGDRKRDKLLREHAVQLGLPGSTVMTPTMTRMAYLTLRGISVARMMESVGDITIFETHPAVTMVSSGASRADVIEMKQSEVSRAILLTWFRQEGFPCSQLVEASDHDIASLACCLAARRFHESTTDFCVDANPPFHPYPLSC